MVFAEALWTELHDKGIDVLGLILGKTDTPALRKLEHERGQIDSPDQPRRVRLRSMTWSRRHSPSITEGPTCLVGPEIQPPHS